MKHWQIVYGLPLEVWMDIFCFPWITRKEFGQLVHKIGNFKFAEHSQFYLHEWGKRKLNDVHFHKDGECKYGNGSDPCRMDIPQTPLPMNIKSFTEIIINHFDAQTIEFLDKLRPLLNDVEIFKHEIPPNCFDNFRTILTTLAPMLNGIRKLWCVNEFAFSVLKELFFCDNEKLAKLKMFDINIYNVEPETEKQEVIAFITNWLAQPVNGGPRLLNVCSDHDFFMQIYKAIREQFLAATTPRTFAVNLKLFRDEERRAAEFHLENSIGEALHGEWVEYEEDQEEVLENDIFQITRHCADYNTEQEREWIEEMTEEKDYPTILIEEPTIGSLDAVVQVDVQPMDEEKQAERQPSVSKDS